MSPPLPTPAVAPAARDSSQRLFKLGLAAVFAVGAYLAYISPLKDPLEIALGLGMVVLAALPALQWARLSRPYFPVFEIFMLTGINFYAVPMLIGQEDVFSFSDKIVSSAGLAVIAFQLPAIMAYFATRGERARHPLLTESLLPEKVLHRAQMGLWLNTLYLYVAGFTTLITWNLAPILRAVFIGLGIICSFIQARRWGEGQLGRNAKIAYCLNLTLQMVFLFSDLYLINGISLIILSLIGYVTTSRRIPIIVILVTLPLVALLHHGKAAMRDVYWRGGQATHPSLVELPAFFEQWINLGFTPSGHSGEKKKSLTANLMERAALFQMLCLTIDRIPDYQPFLSGDTYKDIPAQIVPRILWPNKPSPHQSNARLAIYLSLLDEESAETVSIAFGFLCEAYANFGYLGIVVLGLVLGWAFKRLSLLGQDAPQFSAMGLFLILLTAWSFQVELVMASWLTSLFQAAVVVIGIPFAFRATTGTPAS